MRPDLPFDPSRRSFLRQACCAAVGATGMLSALAQLRVIGAIASDSLPSAAFATDSDYKALVCLFLSGGNDANNLIIPADASSYASYAAARTALTIPQAQLLPISPLVSDGRSYGLHPSLVEVQNLFSQGHLAFLANVGTLVQPTTLAQYNNGYHLPPQLYSHSDQQVQWQSSLPDVPYQTGWGGRLADMVNAMNTNAQVSMSISLNGANSFQVGNTVSQFAVSPSGATVLSDSRSGPTTNNGRRYAAELNIFNHAEDNLFQAAFSGATATAINSSNLISSTLANATAFTTVFPNSSIATQLKMIARLISAASTMGLKRQVFFCQLNGWDLHTSQLAGHATLFSQLSAALNAFYNATVELGVANQVTTFTASDFGRTYNTNSDGSDHGWGSHHLIMGGAVNGQNIYGTMPSLALNGPDDTGRGRWIPSTSVDEYAATLATWFGVSATNLPVVLPNIGRFAHPNLGFI